MLGIEVLVNPCICAYTIMSLPFYSGCNMGHEDESKVTHHSGAFGARLPPPPICYQDLKVEGRWSCAFICNENPKIELRGVKILWLRVIRSNMNLYLLSSKTAVGKTVSLQNFMSVHKDYFLSMVFYLPKKRTNTVKKALLHLLSTIRWVITTNVLLYRETITL